MMKVIETGNGENMLKAMKVLDALSTVADNRVPMASIDCGLPALLIKVALVDDENTSVAALGVLHNLSIAEGNHVGLASIDMLTAMKTTIELRIGMQRIRALYVLLNLSIATVNKVPMTSSSLGLLEQVIKAMNCTGDSCRIPALNVVCNLSVAGRNHIVLVSPSLGLLPVLKFFIEERLRVFTIKAFDTLLNLSTTPSCRMPLSCTTIGLLPSLTLAVANGVDDFRVSSLNVLRNLSYAPGNQLYMASSELGLLDVLQTIVAECIGEAHTIALHIVWNLSCAHENKVPMATCGLLTLLMESVVNSNPRSSLYALNALAELSSADENVVRMAAHSLGFLQLLVRLSAGDNLEFAEIPWSILIILSEADSIRFSMACSETGLLELLAKYAQENSLRRNSAFTVLRKLACSTDNAVLAFMTSPDLGLLPLLCAITARRCDNETVSASAWAVLYSLSFSNDAKVFMVASKLGLLEVLVNAIAADSVDNNEEIRLASLAILVNLSTAIETINIGKLVPALMNVAARGDEYHIDVLNIFAGLSVGPANKVAMTIPEFELVPFLVEMAGSSNELDIQSHALDILVNLADAVDNRVPMASNVSLINLLRACICSNVRIAKIRALSVVSKLALHAGNCELLVSTDLGFVALLKSLLVDTDEFVVKLASDILSRLTHFEAVASKVLSDYGVPLVLFLAACHYQLDMLDAQIIAKGLVGIPGIDAYKQAKADKVQKETELSFALMFSALIPHEFSTLDTLLKQVNWIKPKLNAHSVQLMTTSDDIHLTAFQRFLSSLPPELGSTAGASYAEITEQSVVLAELGNGSIVVNGLYRDGPTDIPVKIKIKRSAHKDMLVHEHKIMDKFHKLAPSVVVAPFALVQASNRYLTTLQKHFLFV